MKKVFAIQWLVFLFTLATNTESLAQCGVSPVPNAIAQPILQSICSGTAINPILISGAIGGTNFTWTRDNLSTVTGIPASGSGNIAGTLVNTTNLPVTVNFTITPSVTGAVMYDEPFNSVLPAGWAQANLSSTVGSSPNWYAGSAFPPYSPTGYIAANLNSAATGADVSNWLFTPETNFNAGDMFSFWTRASSAATGLFRLQVRLSSNGTSTNVGSTPFSVGDFTTVLLDINPTLSLSYPTTWTQFNFTIPTNWGQGRIAFRLFTINSTGNADEIGIDNVKYTSVNAVCTGTPITVGVNVQPQISANALNNQAFCNGANSTAVAITGPVPGVTYNWTNSNPAIGLPASGTGNIPAFMGVNTSNAPISGTITINPSAASTGNLNHFTYYSTISIPALGNASPYGAGINVSGLPTSGVNLRNVSIHGLTHSSPRDLQILLLSPTGQSVILLSDAGGLTPVTNSNLIIADIAPPIPLNGPLISGVYRCTNYAGGMEPDNWPAPGPGILSQPNPSLSMFSTFNYNGLWRLLVVDDEANNAGSINGYTLVFDQPAVVCSGNPTTFTYTIHPTPSATISSNLTPPILPGQIVTLTANVNPPGGTYAWLKDGVLINGANSNTLTGITVNELGDYQVVYADPNGCVDTSSTFNVFAKQATGLFIHPNPNNGAFRVTFYNSSNQEAVVTVYNSQGSVVVQQKFMTGNAVYSKVEVGLNNTSINEHYYVEVRDAQGNRIGSSRVVIAR